MIITRLAGGLGNQMFHYAIARNYLKGGQIYLDTYLLQEEEHEIEKIVQRPFALGTFKNIKATVDEGKLSNLLRGGGVLNRVRRRIFLHNCVVVEQNQMEPVNLPSDLKQAKNLWFIGNFQSERYFEDVTNELVEDFEFPELDDQNKLMKSKIQNTHNAISVHVRRGDYLSSSNRNIFASVSLDYYKNSFQLLSQKLDAKEINAFVFTDDPAWAKQSFSAYTDINFTYISGNKGKDSWKDMALMTACQHHIIANSSFSWWGAWLSTKKGVTLAPRHWYLPNSWYFDINEIVPKQWTVVGYSI